MTEQQARSPWDPESYPWQIVEGFPLATWALEDGHQQQWRLLAGHQVSGEPLETAPYPDLRNVDTRKLRPFVEGVRQARLDAAELMQAGVFDGQEILREFALEDAEREREQEEYEQKVGYGNFERPADWQAVRVHTTITRLFTDQAVHNVTGEAYEPELSHGMLATFSGPVKLLGLGEFDLGISLQGEHRVDLIDAAVNEPGSGVMCMRLLWGPESSVVGAIDCGSINAYGKWVGLGPDGAAREFRSDDVPVGAPGRITTADTPAGTSYWFASGPSSGQYGIYLAVNAEREPVGVILDSSGVTGYYWYTGEDTEYSDWPVDAREFDVSTDTELLNPNVPVEDQERDW